MPDRSTRIRRWLVRLGLSLVVGAGFVWLLRDQIDFVPDELAVPAWVLPAYAGILLAYFFLRAGRWHILLAPLGKVGFLLSLRCALAGIMWIMILPFRLGELARPILIARESDISMSKALGTVAIERVVDGLVVCGLFFAAMALAPESATSSLEIAWLRAAGLVAVAGLCVALVLLLAMGLWPDAVGRTVARPLRLFGERVATRVEEVARGLSEGLAALPSVGPIVAFVAVTLAYWTVNAVGMWVLARGCGLEIDLAQSFAIMATLGITLLLPSAPGMAGTFQAGLVLGLGLFLNLENAGPGVEKYVFYVYVCQLAMGALLGLSAQLTLRTGFRELFASDDDERSAA